MTAVTLAVNYPGYAGALCVNATQVFRSERISQMYIGWKRILQTSDFETLYKVIMPTIMSEPWLEQNRDRLSSLLEAIENRIEHSAALKMVDALVAYSATGFEPEQIASINIPALRVARTCSSRPVSFRLKVSIGPMRLTIFSRSPDIFHNAKYRTSITL